MDERYGQILAIFPDKLKQLFPQEILENTEEIRLRANQPVELITEQGGRLLKEACTPEELLNIMKNCTNHSIYAHAEEIRNGYLTIAGGHRVGFTGRVLHKNGEITTIDHFNSLNIRIARQIRGAAKEVLPYLLENGRALSTLLISPPQVGKTTLLRDVARQLSDGYGELPGFKVGVVDERGELAGCVNGVMQLDVGMRSDVLDGCPKAKGMILLIRSMSPQIIITDEIGGEDDFIAITNAAASGVRVIATAHGSDLEELLAKEYMKKIIGGRFFSRYLVITRENGTILPKRLYKEDLKEVPLTC